jgi:methionyl-tRNA formyltransferase
MTDDSPKILVFASKDVGRICLSHLIDEGYDIGLVVAGLADDQAILDLCKVKGIAARVAGPDTQADIVTSGKRWSWILSLWNPHLLSPALLALGEKTLNLHPAFLPHCRGNDTAAWIIRKQLPAGVTILEMDEGVDTGRIWAQREVAYEPMTKGRELFARLQQELIDLFVEKWADVHAGHVAPVAQSNGATNHTRRQTNQDRVVDLGDDHPFRTCIDWMLAHDFHPGTTAEVLRGGKRYKITLQLDELHDD